MRACASPVVDTRERGAIAVEFALILPLVAMLILGAVTGGLSYSQAIGVQNAVREGARFGATADAVSSWEGDVVSRVRTTQFDDGTTAASSGTSICVQLVKAPSTVVRSTCSIGGSNGPALSMPALADYPAMPTGVAAGTCVVRVYAARKFEISAVLASWQGSIERGASAQYERTCP